MNIVVTFEGGHAIPHPGHGVGIHGHPGMPLVGGHHNGGMVEETTTTTTTTVVEEEEGHPGMHG